jgi:hypothetical protein
MSTTAATATAIRVPVRTWREKAILASTIGEPLAGHYEQLGASNFGLPCVERLLHDDQAVDCAIDAYTENECRTSIASIERLLEALRDVAPGPDATLELPDGFQLLANLEELIDELANCNVRDMLVEVPTQRDIAEATVLAIDLRDELAGV